MKKSPVLALLAVMAVLPLPGALYAASEGSAITSAEPAPQPGRYCPGIDTLYLTLEELTVALDSIAQAQENLLVLKDAATADILLSHAGTALALAAGRGSGSRVANLIDIAIAAKSEGEPQKMLLWFPNLRLAMTGLVDDPARREANKHLAEAEAILQGQAKGDEIQFLRKARQVLVCDPLDIPLQQARVDLARVHRTARLGQEISAKDFAQLTGTLNRALTYGLQRLADLEGQ
jgi:hypothetical protein